MAERLATARAVLEHALNEHLEGEDGAPVSIELRPVFTSAEVAELEKRLGSPLPSEIRDLLSYAGGFEYGPVDFVDFGGSLAFEHAAAFLLRFR